MHLRRAAWRVPERGHRLIVGCLPDAGRRTGADPHRLDFPSRRRPRRGPYALKVAEEFGTSHTDVSISARAAEKTRGFFASMDQPTCDGFNTYVVSKHAGEPA